MTTTSATPLTPALVTLRALPSKPDLSLPNAAIVRPESTTIARLSQLSTPIPCPVGPSWSHRPSIPIMSLVSRCGVMVFGKIGATTARVKVSTMNNGATYVMQINRQMGLLLNRLSLQCHLLTTITASSLELRRWCQHRSHQSSRMWEMVSDALHVSRLVRCRIFANTASMPSSDGEPISAFPLKQCQG